jgi:hypothetical protein
MGNKSLSDSAFLSDKAIRLPNVPHCLNQFDYVDNIDILSALNPSPPHFSFLESKGVTPDQVRIAIQGNHAYQAVLRTSIRTSCRKPKKVLVPDYDTASYLSDLFPNSKMKIIDIGIQSAFKSKKPGRIKKHSSNSDRVKEHRKKQKYEKLKLLNEMYSLNKRVKSPNEGMELCNGNTYTFLIDNFVTQPTGGTLYSAKLSPIPLSYVAYYSDDDFIDFLEGCWETTFENKDDNLTHKPSYIQS